MRETCCLRLKAENVPLLEDEPVWQLKHEHVNEESQEQAAAENRTSEHSFSRRHAFL